MKLLSKNQKTKVLNFVLGIFVIAVCIHFGLTILGACARESPPPNPPITRSKEGFAPDSTIMKIQLRDLGISTSFQSANSSNTSAASNTAFLETVFQNNARFLDFEVVNGIDPQNGNYSAFIGNNSSYWDWSNVRGTLLLKDALTAITAALNEDGAENNIPLLVHLRIKPTAEPERMTAFYNDVFNAIILPHSPNASIMHHVVPPDTLPEGAKLRDLRLMDLVKSGQMVHFILDTTSPVPADANIEEKVKLQYQTELDKCALYDVCSFTSAHVDDLKFVDKDPDVGIYPYETMTVDLSSNTPPAEDVRHLKLLMPPENAGLFSLSGASNANVFYAAKHHGVQCCALKHWVRDEALLSAQQVFAQSDSSTGFVALETLRGSALTEKVTVARKMDMTILAICIAVALFLAIFCGTLLFHVY
jgi:hypothetical protein